MPCGDPMVMCSMCGEYYYVQYGHVCRNEIIRKLKWGEPFFEHKELSLFVHESGELKQLVKELIDDSEEWYYCHIYDGEPTAIDAHKNHSDLIAKAKKSIE